jgi:hypothetical protein
LFTATKGTLDPAGGAEVTEVDAVVVPVGVEVDVVIVPVGAMVVTCVEFAVEVPTETPPDFKIFTTTILQYTKVF